MKPKKTPLLPPSEDFERVFSDGCSGCRRTCDCGRECFDGENIYDWEPGELEALNTGAALHPDQYLELPYACTTATVDGHTFVLGCPCNGLRRYEDWIIRHEVELARYLNLRSQTYQKQAAATAVDFKPIEEVQQLRAHAQKILSKA